MEKENKNGKRKKKDTKSHSDENEKKSTQDSSKKNKSVKTPKRLKTVESIGMSKQLSAKLKTTKTKTRSTRTNGKNAGPRVCGNGKPMPSLSELERMFEDSDSADEAPLPVPQPERCKTPEQPIITGQKLISPTTLKVLSNKMMDLITNLDDTSLLIDKSPPPPVVPPKKRKKPEVPYIVGCKDREQVIRKSNVVIGRAHDKYGVEQNDQDDDDNDDDILKKRKKGGNSASISKSIFNPKSEEIAAMLKAMPDPDPGVLSDSSADSNKTVSYDCNSLSPNSKLRSFSPLPSTSKDNETILKNDLRFNESLLGECVNNDSSQSEVEVIELPCETIIVNDDGQDIKDRNSYVLDTETDVEEVKYFPPAPTFDAFGEDDMYGSIVIDVDASYGNSDCEIVDVDDVIAENKSIIDKIRKDNENAAVTHVKPNNVFQAKREPETAVQESYNNKEVRRESIECVVTDFFKKIDPNDKPTNSNVSQKIVDTIDLSASLGDGSIFKNIVDSVICCAQSLLNSFSNTTPRQQPQRPIILDTIDLNTSDRNDDSVTFVSTTFSKNRLNNVNSNNQIPNINSNQITHVQNRPNVNSVILSNRTSTPINTISKSPSKRKRTNKADNVITPTASQEPAPKQNTPVRNIGDCPICMENLSNTTIASTICGHIFCMSCIKAALKMGGKKCPTCRKPLKGVGYHQLFLHHIHIPNLKIPSIKKRD